MKKIIASALIGALVLSLAACTGKTKTNASEPTSTVELLSVETPSEDQVIEEVVDKPDFTGTYTEPMSGRCTIEIKYISGDDYDVVIRWSSSAAESANWEMKATFYDSTNLLEYTDAKYFVRTYTDDENYTDDVQYEDGAGEFWFDEDGNLGWRSDKADIDGVDGETFFERVVIDAE